MRSRNGVGLCLTLIVVGVLCRALPYCRASTLLGARAVLGDSVNRTPCTWCACCGSDDSCAGCLLPLATRRPRQHAGSGRRSMGLSRPAAHVAQNSWCTFPDDARTEENRT